MRNSVLSFRCNRDVSLSQIRGEHHLKNREMGRKRGGGKEERRREGREEEWKRGGGKEERRREGREEEWKRGGGKEQCAPKYFARVGTFSWGKEM